MFVDGKNYFNFIQYESSLRGCTGSGNKEENMINLQTKFSTTWLNAHREILVKYLFVQSRLSF